VEHIIEIIEVDLKDFMKNPTSECYNPLASLRDARSRAINKAILNEDGKKEGASAKTLPPCR
jgi:hypothetical protein